MNRVVYVKVQHNNMYVEVQHKPVIPAEDVCSHIGADRHLPFRS